MIYKSLKAVAIIVLVLLTAFLIWKGNLSLSVGVRDTLTVTGNGKVKMKPEVARFTVGVQKIGTTVDEAMEAEKGTTEAIVATLKASGIDEEDIKTANFSVWPQMSGPGNITGYMVSNSVEVKVRNIARVSEILGRAIAAGANNVSGLYFGADDPKEQEAEARTKAIEDAKEKAEQLAQDTGRKLGKILSLTEGAVSPVVYPTYRMEGGGGGGPAVEPGNVEITQTVTVVFELK